MESWTGQRIDLAPWQAIPETMAACGLTAEDGLTQAWFVATDGRLSGGAGAINDALKHVWWAKPFAYLYPIPGMRQIQDAVYRWVADNRYRMPGSSDACALPPPPSGNGNE